MNDFSTTPSTAFEGERLVASGALADVALALKALQAERPESVFLTFEDATGRVIDLDLRGSNDDALLRLREQDKVDEPAMTTPAKPAVRGRPKLGVVAREVTLLPRQWDWLAAQPGGASPALRRLVDQARNAGDSRAQVRVAQEACYRFMSAMAGDYPHFEEASRALFANDLERLEQLIDTWPPDVRDYALRLAHAPAQWTSRHPSANPSQSR